MYDPFTLRLPSRASAPPVAWASAVVAPSPTHRRPTCPRSPWGLIAVTLWETPVYDHGVTASGVLAPGGAPVYLRVYWRSTH